MITTRTPLRISLAGGGSDLPAFYVEEAGRVVSMTIDKYVYLTVNPKYDGSVRISYSQTENVAHASEVEHPLVRECLNLVGISKGIEIVSVADVPHGTGLGSSSAFTVGLLAALSAYLGEFRPADVLAHDACQVEIARCGQPIGKQDQYAAAHGGLRMYIFYPGGGVSSQTIPLHQEVRDAFLAHLLLLDTGLRRAAGSILAHQSAAMDDRRKRANVRAMANMAQALHDALLAGHIQECGEIMDGGWALKRALGTSTETIDAWYAAAKRCGAWGGKLCGAGAGGFLLLLAEPERHAHIVNTLGLRAVPFSLVHQGAQVVYAG